MAATLKLQDSLDGDRKLICFSSNRDELQTQVATSHRIYQVVLDRKQAAELAGWLAKWLAE